MDIMSALQKTTSTIKDWTDENKVQKVGGKGLSTNDYTTADKNKVASMPNDLVILDGKLYLAQDGVALDNSGVTLPSGGGGGTSGGSITLKNKLDSTTLTIASGGTANLVFECSSTEDDGNITATIYVSGSLKDTFSIPQGVNTVDASPYISTNGGAVDVKITCTDAYGNQKSLLYTINVIDLRLTSTFDDSQIYNGDADIRYIVYGAVEKDIVFVLDDQVYGTITTSETGKQRTFTIAHQDHGTHTLCIYATATVSGMEVKSNELLYDIMFEDSGVTVPMISSVCSIKSVVQGENVSIGFTVYDPVNMESNITLIIKNGDEVYYTSNRIVDRTKQIWNTRDYPIGENISFIIEYGVIRKTHTITVEENDINVSIKETDLEFQLKAAGKSNEDSDREVWTSGDVTTTFQDLNWVSNGWIADENGDIALRLSGKAKAIINFQPFSTDARQTGRTLEFTFAIRDVNDRKAVAISCMNDKGIGFYATADTSAFSSEQSTVSCNYADEEKISISYIIEPRNENRMLSVYLNGILSGVKQYSDTDNFQQSIPQSIEIGSPYCSIDLYSIRSYNVALTPDEIKENYIADITDISTKAAVYEDNDVYDIYGELSFSKVQNKLPVFLITGELPTYKGDKKKVTVSFTHPEKSSLNYEDSATLDVQGTSSQFSKLGTVLRNQYVKTLV